MTADAQSWPLRRPRAEPACSAVWSAERDRVARVARAALDLMHLENIDAAVAAANPDLLRDKEGAECVKGCYRCLLVLLQPARP